MARLEDLLWQEATNNEIKGRIMAGGNKQWDNISKEDANSPTVATKAVLLTCIIYAEEGQAVATVEIPDAFIQTKIEMRQTWPSSSSEEFWLTCYLTSPCVPMSTGKMFWSTCKWLCSLGMLISIPFWLFWWFLWCWDDQSPDECVL